MKIFLPLFLAAVGIVTALSCSVSEEPERPSILFILVDTLRSDHCSCYGYARPTTPNIDKLASEGVRFDCARSQSSWTLPSMISLMSGRYIFSEIPAFPSDTPSLPQMMKKRGYATAGFIANSLVGEKEGFKNGFDHFEIRQHKTPQWSAKDLNNRLLPWMKTNLKPPFFLYLHYLDPHYPYSPPPELAEFDGDFDPISQEKQNYIGALLEGFPEFAENATEDMEKMRKEIDLYDGEIRLVDQCVGEVLETLKALKLDEETVIILTSDHGECLWDHPHYLKDVEKKVPREQWDLTHIFFRDHGYHLFEELIRVPMIIKGPGIEKGFVIHEGVENVDLVHTILALAGDTAPFSSGDGRNLVPAISDRNTALVERPVLFSHCNEGTCIIDTERKLKLITPNKVGRYFGLEYSLFDLARDPREYENRMECLEQIDKDAARALNNAIQEKEKNDYFMNRTGEMDQDTYEKMKELGYVE